MKVAGFIANRIAFNQQRSFSRFIIRLSTIATVISVMVMIITLSLINGFKETVSHKVFSFIGHIRVLEKEPDKAIISEETPILRNDTVAAAIRQHPDVESVNAYAARYAIFKTKAGFEGVQVKGYDRKEDLNQLEPFLEEGRMISFSDTNYSKEVVLSANTASKLQLKVNDGVLIYFIGTGGETKPRVNKLTVVGIYKTGITEYDDLFAITDIRLVQWSRKIDTSDQLYKQEISGYEVFLTNYKKIKKTTEEIYEEQSFPITWNTVSAQKISPNIFDWLDLQDKNSIILIIIVAIVAFINLITCFLILVLERVRMIGILKSLGATDWTIQKIFLRHASIITITGIIIGALLALGLLWLQQSTGFIRLKEETYYVNTAAVKIVWWQVLAVCTGTLVICFLVLTIPSLLVKRIQPVRAVRFR